MVRRTQYILFQRCFPQNVRSCKLALQLLILNLLFTWAFSPMARAQGHAGPLNKEAGLPFIQNFSPKDYGAGGQNWAIVQDPRGIMYFGNGTGVLEYDGVSWRIIPTANKSTVRSLALDKNGCIFVGAQGDFGYLAADEIGRFHYLSLLEHVPPKFRDFADVWETLATSHGIYFRTNKYLFRWQGNESGEGTMSRWPAETSFAFAFAIQDNIYVGQGGIGLFKLTGDSLHLAPAGDQFLPDFVALMLPFHSRDDIDKESALLITGTGKAFLYDGLSFARFPPDGSGAESLEFLKKNRVFRGTVLPDGAFVIGTLRGGVAIIERDGRLRQVLNRAAGLRDEAVFSVYPDRESGLWIAMNNGLARAETASPLSLYKEELGVPTNVEDFVRYNGQLYAATGLGVFMLLPSPTGKNFPEFQQVPGISRQVFSLLSAQQTLLAASPEGLFLINQSRAVLITNIYSFRLYHAEYNRNIVFAGLEQGLAVLQYIQGKWRFEGLVKGISEQVRTIVEDPPGLLWLGTRNRGYLRLDYRPLDFPGAESKVRPGIRDEIFTTEIERFGTAHGVAQGMAYCYSATGRVVFATQSGLRRFDPDQRRFIPDSTFSVDLADTARWITTVTEDNAGGVWISSGIGNISETGVALPDKNGGYTWNSRLFARASEAGATVNGIYPDPERPDVIWFGMNEGVVRYAHSVQKEYKMDFPALVRRVIVGGDSVIYGGAGLVDRTGWSDSRVAPTLDYSNNALRFEYAAPSFDDPARNSYQVLLEGFDNTWSGWNTETQKDYTNTPEGNYTFRVRAKNIYAQLSNEGKFSFTILAPWYRRWWAYLLYALLAGGSFLLLTKIRMRQLERKTRELETVVAERTAEIVSKNEQLAEQAERLTELDKLKSRFFANISHEFRTPLTLILGPLAHLQSVSKERETRKQLPVIIRNGKRLLQLINQLLDLSKLEAGALKLNLQPHDVISFLKGVLYAFSSRAEQHNISLLFNSEYDSLIMEFDQERFEEIFANLLSNAFKFTEDGGKIEVAVSSSAQSEFIEMMVKDSGVGIPAEKMLHIFDRFYQADSSSTREYEGSGIGLALTKELVELHGGRISVESDVGKGTTFIVRLPVPDVSISDFGMRISDLKEKGEAQRAERMAQEKKPLTINQQLVTSSNETSEIRNPKSEIVLLVEDHPDMRAYIRQHLDGNYKILEAKDGKEGLASAIDNIPDLIISDVMMPKMGGFELCEKLKTDERTSHIPVIILTAKAEESDKLAGLETGADAYLTKPFSARELQVRVKNLIEQRRKLRKRFSQHTMLKPAEVAVTSIDQQFLEKIIKIVEAHIGDEQFNVESLADEAAMHKKQLTRKLRALTGLAPGQFILSFRLQRAAELIRKNAGSIADISYQTGFNAPAYFSKVFRKQYGCTPREYRERSN